MVDGASVTVPPQQVVYRALNPADLRTRDSDNLETGALSFVASLNAFFAWSPISLAVDNGATVIKPDDRSSLQMGRWIFSSGGNVSEAPIDGTTYGRKDGAWSAIAADTISFQALPADSVVRNLQAKSREVVSIRDFGAIGDDAADDTAAFQAGFDAIASGEISHIFIPDGTYRVADSIKVTSQVITGRCITGQSRHGTVIKQMTDNMPIFEFTSVNLHHTWDWSNFTATWDNPQDGNTNAAVWLWTGLGASNRSMYNCTFEKLYITNCYWAMKGADVLFWGNCTRDVWCSTRGGFVDLNGTAGNPKVLWEGIYISGGAAGVYLFNVQAMNCEYQVEVNGTSSPMIFDGSGGTHHIRHWALEVANYAASAILFDVQNSKLICYGTMYADTLTIGAAATVVAFRGTQARCFVENFKFSLASHGAGSSFFVSAYSATTGRNIRFGDIEGTFTAYAATPIAALMDFGGSVTPAFVTVDRWNDPGRAIAAGDADVALVYDSARTINFGVALTAARKVVLPPSGAASGQTMFDGRMFEVVKLTSAGTGFDINIYLNDGVTLVASIPAATATARVKLSFSRSNPSGGGGLGFFTVVP